MSGDPSAAVGILAAGAYVPTYRVARRDIGHAWRLEQAAPLLVGRRAVAGYDEDSVTMAVEAALQALAGGAGTAVDALLLATTTPPFGEKAGAPIVAAAARLDVARAVDVTDSLQAGTAALSLALDAVQAGSARQVLVAAADMRRGEPGTLLEAVSGDGAAALLVGRGDVVIAELVGAAHLADPVIDVWRRSQDRYLHSDDEAFTRQVGYFALVDQAFSRLLQETGVAADQIAGAAVYAPDGAAYLKLARSSPLAPILARLGRDGPAPRLLQHAGNLGAAFPLAQFSLLLETAAPGDFLALVGYGDGADAYLFQVTPAIQARRPPPLQAWLDSQTPLSYTLAQYFRENLKEKPLFPPFTDPWTSLPLLHRERRALLRFEAQRCGRCGALWWPARPGCYECGAQDGFAYVPLSRRGAVASFVAEWAIPTPLPPVGMAIVDTPEGARITTPTTGGDPRRLAIGDAVEFGLRIFHTAKDLPHYAWKVRQTPAS